MRTARTFPTTVDNPDEIGAKGRGPGLPPWAIGLIVTPVVLVVGGVAAWYYRRRRGGANQLDIEMNPVGGGQIGDVEVGDSDRSSQASITLDDPPVTVPGVVASGSGGQVEGFTTPKPLASLVGNVLINTRGEGGSGEVGAGLDLPVSQSLDVVIDVDETGNPVLHYADDTARIADAAAVAGFIADNSRRPGR